MSPFTPADRQRVEDMIAHRMPTTFDSEPYHAVVDVLAQALADERSRVLTVPPEDAIAMWLAAADEADLVRSRADTDWYRVAFEHLVAAVRRRAEQ